MSPVVMRYHGLGPQGARTNQESSGCVQTRRKCPVSVTRGLEFTELSGFIPKVTKVLLPSTLRVFQT